MRCVAPGSSAEQGSSRRRDRKSTRLNSSHGYISYAVFCLKKKKNDLVRRPESIGDPSHTADTRTPRRLDHTLVSCTVCRSTVLATGLARELASPWPAHRKR